MDDIKLLIGNGDLPKGKHEIASKPEPFKLITDHDKAFDIACAKLGLDPFFESYF